MKPIVNFVIFTVILGSFTLADEIPFNDFCVKVSEREIIEMQLNQSTNVKISVKTRILPIPREEFKLGDITYTLQRTSIEWDAIHHIEGTEMLPQQRNYGTGTEWFIDDILRECGLTKFTFAVTARINTIRKDDNQLGEDTYVGVKYVQVAFTTPVLVLMNAKISTAHRKLYFNPAQDAQKAKEIAGYDYGVHNELLPQGEWHWPAQNDDNKSYPMTHNAGTYPEVELLVYNSGNQFSTSISIGGQIREVTFPTKSSIKLGTFKSTTSVGIKNNKITLGLTESTIDLKLRSNAGKEYFNKAVGFLFCTTVGEPKINVTPKRLVTAYTAMDASCVVTDREGKFDTIQSLTAMIEKNTSFGSGHTSAERDLKRWMFFEELEKQKKKAGDGLDCTSHTEFFLRVCQTLGLNGQISADTFIAAYATPQEPNRPLTAFKGNYNIGKDNTEYNPLYMISLDKNRTTASDASKYARLKQELFSYRSNENLRIPDLSYAFALIFCNFGPDGSIIPNNYEGTLVVTLGNKTYYFPGGTKLCLTDKNRVVTDTIKSMHWITIQSYKVKVGEREVEYKRSHLDKLKIQEYQYSITR
jgi:hypothetical protein